MDLTKSYPRSVRDQLGGVVMAARTADKAAAKAHGEIGEYHFNCPMDVALFEFLGIDHEKFYDVVKDAESDDEIAAYVKSFADKKSPEELATFNSDFLVRSPAPGTDSEKYFLELRNSIAPDRTDVTAWPDLLDLDEKRDVPVRAGASA